MTGRLTNDPADSPTIAKLRLALHLPLPGLSAQLEMAPAYRDRDLQNRVPPPAPREAAVLVVLYPHDGKMFFPLTLRSDSVEKHKGQVSLPGGAREGDEPLQTTALRETCEELNVCPESLNVIGRLTPLYIPPSGFLISPFVAHLLERPAFRPDPTEVAQLIEAPLNFLMDPNTVVREEWSIHGISVDVPFYHIHGHKVWGATAMVLSEFVAVVRN